MKTLKNIFVSLLILPAILHAQDTTKIVKDSSAVIKNDYVPAGKILPEDTTITDIGVAVSPSHVNFTLKPGQAKTQIVKVTNDTRKTYKFKVSFSDFDIDGEIRNDGLPAGTGKYSLSKWINASPTFFELKPGEAQKISLTVTIPEDEAANKAAWCLMMIDQADERKELDWAGSASEKKLALGVFPVFSFGVYLYQNPPHVAVNKVEIKKFQFIADTARRKIDIQVQNMGDGIAFCTSYVELTNLNNGKQQKLLVKKFTIYPGGVRNFLFDLPKNLDKGKYSAVGVIDFGSKEELQAAEMEFQIE